MRMETEKLKFEENMATAKQTMRKQNFSLPPNISFVFRYLGRLRKLLPYPEIVIIVIILQFKNVHIVTD